MNDYDSKKAALKDIFGALSKKKYKKDEDESSMPKSVMIAFEGMTPMEKEEDDDEETLIVG